VPQATNRPRGECGLTSCRGHRSEALGLERTRDREGDSETAWCTDYWRGECPGRGWWLRELKEAKKPPVGQNTRKLAPKTGYTCSKFRESYMYAPGLRVSILRQKLFTCNIVTDVTDGYYFVITVVMT
jgi:hypothetical protein